MPCSDENVWAMTRLSRLLTWAAQIAPMGPYEPKHLFGRIPTFQEAWTGIINPKYSVYDAVLARQWQRPKRWVSVGNSVFAYLIFTTVLGVGVAVSVLISYFLSCFVESL
jgi:hypothetical protein